MKLKFVVLSAIAILGGCSKVDKELCWKQETKDSARAIVANESNKLSKEIADTFGRKSLQLLSNNISTNFDTSEYSLEKIDEVTGSIDCSFKLTITVDYNYSAKLKSEGKVRFVSRTGEHGRYLEVIKNDIQPIIYGLSVAK